MESKLTTAIEEMVRDTGRETEGVQRALLSSIAPEGWRVQMICTIERVQIGLLKWLYRSREDTADEALVGLRLAVGAQKRIEAIKADMAMWAGEE